jgi:hypothetical protein
LVNIKLLIYKALIRPIKVYACPTWEYAADAHLLKLQCLQNRVLRAVGNFDRPTPVRELHVAFKLPDVYDYITKLWWKQADVIQNRLIQMYMQLDKEKSCIGSIMGLNLVVVRLTSGKIS